MDGGKALGWLLVGTALGCGPSVEEPITRLATCGEDGPVRVLEHGPEWRSSAQQFGDDLVVRVFPWDWDREDAPPDETWVVGPCGENPRLVAHGLDVYPWGELLLACDSYDRPQRDIVRVDPSGQSGPVVLFEDVDCSFLVTEYGWLAPNYEHHELWLQPDPQGEVPAERIANDFLKADGGCPVIQAQCDPGRLTNSPIHYINVQNELVQLDPGTRERTIVKQDASWVWLSPDGWLWWKERGQDENAPTPVHVVDPSTGEDRVLYEGDYPLRTWPYTLARIDGSADKSLIDVEQRVVHEIPSGITAAFSRPGVDGILASEGGTQESYLWSPEEQRAIPLGPTRGGDICSREWWTHGLDIVRQASCHNDDGELWTVPYDGSEARLVATGVSRRWQHNDGQVAWSSNRREIVEGLYVGDLFVATDPDERLRLDDSALFDSWPHKDLSSDVLYTVSDGDRSGLWRSATE